MNVFQTLCVALLVISGAAHAAIPAIEQAPGDVQGYIRCIQHTYAANQWQAGTVAQCRASNPAVRSLREGDYNGVTFTQAQNELYEQARAQWIDFDKSLREQLLSKRLAEQFKAANVLTSYSFERVARDLDTRFAEMNEAPFSWYPATKAPYTTASGLSLTQLHNAELGQFSQCLEAATTTLKVLTRAMFEGEVTGCTGDITQHNVDGSNGLYKPQAFRSVADQVWAQIASQQAQAEEAKRVRLAKEEAESWPNRIKVVLKQVFTGVLVIGALFIAWMVWRNLPAAAPTRGTGRRRQRHEDDDDDDEYVTPPTRQRHESRPVERKPDLNTFTLHHRRVSKATTPHWCASCIHWRGERVQHPVMKRDTYVKVGTIGNCAHKHPGSPYGMKHYDAGFHCKDFEDGGY
ncbi:hypothetical protein SAMN04487857_102243 [Pseudomonas sp. ok272]|uniref:hypothetical protein n=1 Tax=unclassified Pseudomonas TaxID=196821 RepID=UPI0008BBDE7D|nr:MULTISPECIES: hypothetical protein [unclassified Pseudomonas]SEM48748.1 hypothetical protein SAMN04487857_102243 [Pseudomonas sp. ok272]SFM20313.1 hypothetical protein SAMN04487858_101244 [Pseudomonas sp. ok602]